MKTMAVVYIENENHILLGNWKKYGKWCGIGDYVNELHPKEGLTNLDLLNNLLDIKISDIRKIGTKIFVDRKELEEIEKQMKQPFITTMVNIPVTC